MSNPKQTLGKLDYVVNNMIDEISWGEVINNLNDLVETKNLKIEGMSCAIEILKKRQRKALRELEYLRARYDSEVERRAIERAIEVVKESYEQV